MTRRAQMTQAEIERLIRAAKAQGCIVRLLPGGVAFICAELMHELLTVDGQAPYVMESWNVSRKGGDA